MSDTGPRVGLRVAQYGSDWERLRDGALHAERRAFHTLWVNDHLRTPGRLHRLPAFDAFTTLAALAPLTRTARLGVAVLSASYRPPALAAKMATGIDAISGGRLTIGLGTGSDVEEHRAYGVPFGSGPERATRLEVSFTVMRALLDTPRSATVAGHLIDAQNLPAPTQAPPPIWIAANKRRLLRFAGERADGLVVAFTDVGGVTRRLAVAAEAAEAAGRPPLACALYTYVLPVESRSEAERWLRAEADALESTPARVMRWLATTGLVGTASGLRERLSEYGKAGVTDAILVLPNQVPPEAIDALADAVLAGETPTGAPSAGLSPRANLADLLVERHRRAGRGGDTAVIQGEQSWSFDALHMEAGRSARALAALGVRRGDRVIVALPDGIDWVRAFLGTIWLGAVAVPLDPQASDQRLSDVVADCEPSLVVTEDDRAVRGELLVVSPGQLLDAFPRPPAPVHPEELAYLIYSSGSTGRPKAAMHSHDDPGVSVATYATEVLELQAGDRCFSVARLFTSFGFGNGFFRPLGRGAAAVLMPRRPTVRSVLATVSGLGITVLSGVPTFWSQLVTFLERHPDPGALVGVRLAVSSGDSLPGPVADALVEVTGVALIDGLGCSECSNTIISWRIGEHLPGTLGRAVDGVEIRLADDDGQPVPHGAPGRLWVRSDSNTSGYWRRKDLTRELVHGAWLRMGDMLREIDPGVYRHIGRSDDLFKVDAQWVSPTEVEASLLSHPAVSEAAVVGRPDERGLLRPCAYVVRDPEVPVDDLGETLRRHVAHALAPFMAPTWVMERDELPRLPSGKLDRRALRETLEEGD